MTTLQIELPNTTAQAARAAGLLTPQALDRLLNEALRKREAANSLLSTEGAGFAVADIAKAAKLVAVCDYLPEPHQSTAPASVSFGHQRPVGPDRGYGWRRGAWLL